MPRKLKAVNPHTKVVKGACQSDDVGFEKLLPVNPSGLFDRCDAPGLVGGVRGPERITKSGIDTETTQGEAEFERCFIHDQ